MNDKPGRREFLTVPVWWAAAAIRKTRAHGAELAEA